jgi:spore maturation protein CgeB
MTTAISSLLSDYTQAQSLAQRGLATIRARHTCAHRVDELLAIHASLDNAALPGPRTARA